MASDAESTSDIPCTVCGKTTPAHGRYCAHCGARNRPPERCLDCETQIPLSARFCPGCGATVVGQRSQGETSPSEAEDEKVDSIAAKAAVDLLRSEGKKARSSNIGTNLLFFVAILLAFLAATYAYNKDAPPSISPFSGGPPPSTPNSDSSAPVGESAAPDQTSLSGTITIDESQADKVKTNGTVFVIVRASGMPSVGPPLAAKRFAAAKFPLQFSVGSQDVMMQGMPWAGPFQIDVRLDGDGNAMTKDATDLLSTTITGLTAGTKDIQITLSRRAQDPAPKPTAAPDPTPVPGDPKAAQVAGKLSVRVELSAEMQAHAAPGATLYVIVRPQMPGPPLAAKRIPDPQFPSRFVLGPEDVMLEGVPFVGPFKVEARLDGDGDAMTKAAGDLVTAAPVPADVGQEVVLRLSRRLEP